MKLKLTLSTLLVLALGGAAAYIFTSKSEWARSARQRVESLLPAVEPTLMEEGGAKGTQEPQPEPVAGPTPAPEPQPEPAVEPTPAPEPQPEPAVEPTPAPEPQPEPVVEPTPAPEPQPEPVAEPTPAPSVSVMPDIDYGKPGEGHGPELYPEQYAEFVRKLDDQVKRNSYDFCPAVQVVLAATNDEFAFVEWLKKAAAEGNAAAMLYLAEEELGEVTKEELLSPRVQEAYKQLCKAAALGYSPAMCVQNECLDRGVGVKKDPVKAKQVLMEACKDGSFIPRLRWLVLSGRMDKWSDRELPEVKAEIDRNNHHVIYYLSRLAPDSVTQLKWLKDAAGKGNDEAYFDLARVSLNTQPRDSYELLKAAAKLHQREALYLLGSSLLAESAQSSLVKTLGIQSDERLGMHFIKSAAALRSPSATYFLGRCYYDGRCGLPQDKALAYRHFSKAVAMRSPQLFAAHGLMLLTGEGGTKDEKRGLSLIAAAANGGYPYGICLMAYAHYKGLGTEADAARASEYLQEAAALGQPSAYVYLAFITAKGGAGLEPDQRMAESYMRMASVDMREKAQELYAKLEAAGEWIPEP